jgi:hypothetical protein
VNRLANQIRDVHQSMVWARECDGGLVSILQVRRRAGLETFERPDILSAIKKAVGEGIELSVIAILKPVVVSMCLW